MSISTFSSREFNHSVSKIKKATALGPVFITDRGQPAHVLLAIDDYLKLTKTKESIVDLLQKESSGAVINLTIFWVPRTFGRGT